MAPLLADEFAGVVDLLRGKLLFGIAINHERAGDLGAAINAYRQALSLFITIDDSALALNTLQYVYELSAVGGAPVALNLVLILGELSVRLGRFGEAANDLVNRTCAMAFAASIGEALSTDDLLRLYQVAKGQAFATALYAGPRFELARDKTATALLEEIQQLQLSEPAIPQPASHETDADPVRELLFPVEKPKAASGDDARVRLMNLKSSFDASMNEGILKYAAGDEALLIGLEDIQAALDERTVLANFYLGAMVGGAMTVHLMLITRENVVTKAVLYPLESVASVPEEILSLREALQKEPGPRAFAVEEALQRLGRDATAFANLGETLEPLRTAGKDHLCIVPHGPLHYYPFHLLGAADRPLAQDWIVTYQPNLHLFISRRGRPAVSRHRERELSAVGLSFIPPADLGLAPMRDSVSEVQAIADAFGAQPIVEEHATPSAVREALLRSRRVHLSTHGEQDAAAPAFQWLQFTPDGDDGRLYAYDVLTLDLRGLELLTLSACETALGRFDARDNIRGLPANLLLAGVSTIVATLWPVESKTSARFFMTMYQRLKAGSDRLAAFASAQRDVRRRFPQYRDWGAFYYIGDSL